MNSYKLISGMEVPMIGFGPDTVKVLKNKSSRRSFKYRVCNKLYKKFISSPQYVKAISSSLKIGYRLIDYSSAYGNGSLILEGIKKSGINRKEILLTTRISNKTQYNGDIELEFYEQLKGFDTDYIDILMFHWPVPNHFEETWIKMIELKKKGLCKVLGVSNCNIHHLERLYQVSGEYPEINQFEAHPLFSQVEMRHFCKEHNIQVEAYSPTARHDDRLYNPALLNNLSQKYNKSITQLILRWHIQNGMIPIIRSLNPKHLQSDLDIFDFVILDEDMKKIDGLNINSRMRYDPDNCDFKSL